MATRGGATARSIWIDTRIACPCRRHHPRRRTIQKSPIEVFLIATTRGTRCPPSRTTSIADSSDRRRVLDAALGPEPVDAAADAELRACSHIALEYFAVIADLLDDAHHPVLGQTELLAEIALDAQQAPDLGLIRFECFVDGLGGYAELLGIEYGVERPFDDVEPLIVAMAHHRPEWFLGNDLGQDDVVVGIGELELFR